MPKQVYVESRDQTIEVPDDFTPEEIQNAIAASFSDGQDIAFDLQKFQEAGGNTKDFIAGISDEDYIKLNNFRSDKNMTAAELGGITLGAAKELFKDVLKGAYSAGKTMLEAPAKGDNLATAKVLSSAARGVGAGTIDLAQLGLKLLDPTKRIPTFDEFAKPVTYYGYGYGLDPNATSRAATPEDYKNLIDSERKKELAALEMVEAADKLVQGASLEDVAKGARVIDAFTIAGLARSLAKGVGKGIAKKGFYEATTGIPAAGAAAPGKVSQTAAKVAEVLGKAPAAATFAGAKAAEVAAKGVKIPLDVARKLAENEVVRGALGAGIGYSQGDIKGAVTGLTAATIGTAVASKFLEGAIAGSQFIGTAAKGALNSASRTGFVEQMLKNPKVSPSVRKIANALLPLQPAFQFAGQVAKETAKDFIPAAGIGAGLGYMAGGEEGAAAGIGSALGVSALTGPIKASVSAVKTLAKAPTARGNANALGDIKTFVNAIPDEKSRIEYAQIMDQAIKVAGPERAADMLDALRLAEAHGATVVVGPKDSPNSFSSVGNIISVNPSKLNSGTVFHETVHQLVNVGVRASLLPELRNLYDGIRDADGNILKQGLYTEADWAAKAKELAESYKNNPIGYKMALDYANKLDNPAGYSPEAIQEAKDFVLDEATAIYAERLMGRSRPGAFNPDRLPMWHRNLLEQIDNRVLDNLATELYSGQTNLNKPSKAFTDANGRPVRIPQLDVILRKALSGKYPKSGGAVPKQAAPKTVPIPKNPVDVSKFAQATFGATRDILGTDENGNPRLLTEKEHQAIAKADYEAAVQAFQQLSPDEQATVRLVNRKGEPASITDKDYQIQITSATPDTVFERFLRVAKDRGMGNQQLATMRQLYASMVSPEGPTFDTVNNPVWKYSKRTGQMESTVRPPTRQEIYPLFIHVNSAGGFNVKYIDLSRLKQNAQKIMSNPKHTGIWPSMDAFMDDFKRSMRNLSAEGKQPDTPSGSKSTAELLGNGDENLGAVKRDLIAEALNVTLPERLKSKGYENEPVFEPLSLIGKEKRGKRIAESAFRDFRIERVTEITPTNERLKVVQENAYDKLVRRFQPDSFTPETLPNGEAWTNPDGYRILKKAGSKLYRVYDKDGTEIGVTSSQDDAIKKAQDSFLKSEKKAENVRFQQITPEQDAAYLNAVKSGDSETAQRMVEQATKNAAPSKSVILYRGLEKPFDPNYDPNMRDSPSGYSTWTDNPLLARQYAGEDGSVYAIFVPKSEVKSDYINVDGDRSFVFPTGKAAGLNNVSGKEFLLYEDHDLFSPSQIKSVDPVTYDDAGNVIPLSQRFNPVSNDIRFQPDEPATTKTRFQQITPEQFHQNVINGLNYAFNKMKEKQPSELVKVGNLFIKLSNSDDTFIAKKSSKSKSIEDIVVDLGINKIPELKDIKVSDLGYIQRPSGGWSNTTRLDTREGYVHIFHTDQYAWIDSSKATSKTASGENVDAYSNPLKRSKQQLGQASYQILGLFAKNNNLKVIPDPAGVSPIANIRRLDAMLAAALRAKDTSFIELNPPPPGWTGGKNFAQDIGALALFSTEYVNKFFPQLKELKLSKDKTTFIHNGSNISPEQLPSYLLKNARPSVETGIGEKTLRRAILSQFDQIGQRLDIGEILDSDAELLPDNGGSGVSAGGSLGTGTEVLQAVLSRSVMFQPDEAMPSVLNGSNGARIIKSNSGKFRVYSGTGALLGIRDNQQAAEKLAAKP